MAPDSVGTDSPFGGGSARFTDGGPGTEKFRCWIGLRPSSTAHVHRNGGVDVASALRVEDARDRRFAV
jgi:hypothetical protein